MSRGRTLVFPFSPVGVTRGGLTWGQPTSASRSGAKSVDALGRLGEFVLRIAYVNLQLGIELSGVTRSISGQALAARRAGANIDFWVVNADVEGEREGVRYARVPHGLFGVRGLRLAKSRVLASIEPLSRYDVVFLRYPMAIDVDALALIRRRQFKVVTVHHTKEVEEFLSTGRNVGMRVRAAIEQLNGPRILRRVDGIIGVTDEIRRYEVTRSGASVPSSIISNGVDVATIRQTAFTPFDGRELKLLFIASSHAPWHGTDRLLESVRRYRGSVRLVLHMVGEGSGAPRHTIVREGPLTIHHHGKLTGAELDAVFGDATLAFSSLALFRNGLREGCVLKTREYVARGLPFVYGYDDVDLPDDCDFALKIPGTDAPFEIEPIIEFASKVSQRARVADEMHAFALRRLDWQAKMKEFAEFAGRLA